MADLVGWPFPPFLLTIIALACSSLISHHPSLLHAALTYVQSLAIKWSLGCVNSFPAARGSYEVGFMQPRDHLVAHLCIEVVKLGA